MREAGENGVGPVARGVAVIVVGMLAAGTLSLAPAVAAKTFTKKKALKLFYKKAAVYTKGEADSLFGEEGDVLWARVAADGTLLGGDGVTTSRRDELGGYLVTFERSAVECAKLATSNDNNVFAFTDAQADPNIVEVFTRDADDLETDTPFSVALLC